jgi:hypothetical protein
MLGRISLARRREGEPTLDSMTGLPSLRASNLDVLRDGSALAVVDLVHFMDRINFPYGDAVGDRLLATVADRLRLGLAPDGVFRSGVDEFTVEIAVRSTRPQRSGSLPTSGSCSASRSQRPELDSRPESASPWSASTAMPCPSGQRRSVPVTSMRPGLTCRTSSPALLV